MRNALAAVLWAFVLMVGGSIMNAGWNAAAEPEQTMTMESDILSFALDAGTGLGTVYDKRTGQTWSQYFMLPPRDAEIPQVPLSDTSYWTVARQSVAGEAARPDMAGDAVVFTLDDTFASGSIQTVFPGTKISKGHYRMEVVCHADHAAGFDVTLRADFHAGNYDYRNNAKAHLGNVQMTRQYSQTVDGEQRICLDIPEECFKEHTTFARLGVTVRRQEHAAGTIRVDRIVLRGLGAGGAPVVISDVRQDDGGLTFSINSDFRHAAGSPPFQASIAFERADTLVYTISSSSPEDEFAGRLIYPPAFHNGSAALKWVLPYSSGAYLGSFDLDSDVNKKLFLGRFYNFEGLSMAFFGADDGDRGGYLEVIDTPVLANVAYPVSDVDGRAAYMPQVTFDGDKYRWGQDRQVRFRFCEDGRYVSLAREYKTIAKEKGFHVTLAEKAKTNPVVAATAGCHRMDLGIPKDEVLTFFEKMRRAGVTNILTKLDLLRDPQNGYRFSHRQTLIDEGIYRDVTEQYPEFPLYAYEFPRYHEVGAEEGKVSAIVRPVGYAALADQYISTDGNGHPRTWFALNKQIKLTCPKFWPVFTDFNERLFPPSAHPVGSMFYDTFCTFWFDEGQCSHPDHPCSTLETYEIVRSLAERLSQRYDFHTEGAAEYLIPYTNSFEGAIDFLGLQGYGCLEMEDGRERSGRFAREAEKIPLWQLVYHECAPVYWHWEYGNLALPVDLTQYLDLFVMLYGEKGMFILESATQTIHSAYFQIMLKRMRTLNQVTQTVPYQEMVDHQFLTADGKVQRTRFSDGLTVTVNFSKEDDYVIDGEPLAPLGYRIQQ